MGCAMGTVCSPCHVNLFMAQFEEKHITYTSKIWLSYIDDIFITWKGSKEQLTTFTNELNKNKELLNLNTKFYRRKSHSLIQW